MTLVVEFGVGPLLETISEDNYAAAGSDLEIEFDVPVTEDIIVAMILLLLLILRKEH